MKTLTTTIIICLFSLNIFGQASYKGIQEINATSSIADYRIGNDWVKGNWTISPQIESDSLIIPLYAGNEEFAFYTDVDSTSFLLQPGEVRKFYVLLNGKDYALTVIKGVEPNFSALRFDSRLKNSKLEFWYEQNENNDYLDQLRAKYPVDSLVRGGKTDTEKALRILHWVHNQWEHNGSNEPTRNDAISILDEARQGKNFRCVEYGIVTTACLDAIGLKARTLALKTKDVETTRSGAGHVLLEVYLNDLKKWALLDGQWDIMPFLNNVPLNAVELQKAIAENYRDLEIRSASGVSKRQYVDWIYPYLYYFDISFDNREGTDFSKRMVDGKKSLMLVPIGAKNPTVFQVKNKIDYCLYTHSLKDFYAPPH